MCARRKTIEVEGNFHGRVLFFCVKYGKISALTFFYVVL
ncbi:hypothetical protein K737_300547 [Holospora undulata HU1]|uniref:Uncharacterized protein n=1 Tax=Holospora undulata HU1 TaxID=1321371 RepID=A0A061JHS9_9PROT|nr:hypothetical protein K737_300547 [Holospora undulata HU1]